MCADADAHVEIRVWFSAHCGGSHLPAHPVPEGPMPSSGFCIRNTHGTQIFLEAKHTDINFVIDNYSRIIDVILFTYAL